MYASSRYAVRVEEGNRTPSGTPTEKFISSEIPSNIGTMQGCQLSPLLFIVFINELAEFLTDVEGSHPPAFGEREVPALLFADDLVCLSCSPGGLQKLLNKLDEFCEHFRMEVNPKKSKIMVFKKGGNLKKCEKWFFRGSRLEISKQYKYLGLTLSSNSNWNHHLAQCQRKMIQSAGPVLKFVERVRTKRFFSLGLRLFDAMIAPVGLYGSEIFAFSNLEKMDGAARRFFKKLLGLPVGAPNVGTELICGRRPLSVQAKTRAFKYWLKLIRENNDRLTKIAYEHQRRSAEQGRSCWALDVKNLLNKLSMSYLWRFQGRIQPDSFRRILKLFKTRLNDSIFTEQIEASKSLKSTTHLSEICRPNRPILAFNFVESKCLYRSIARFALNCPGGIIERVGAQKICSACDQFIEGSAFQHRVLSCPKFEKKRAPLLKKPWFKSTALLPSHVILSRFQFSRYIEFMKFFL